MSADFTSFAFRKLSKIRPAGFFQEGLIMDIEEYKSLIKKVTFEQFVNYTNNIKLGALYIWLGYQTEDVQRIVLALEPYMNQLIDKYGDKAGINLSDRKFYAVGLSIKIVRNIYFNISSLDANEAKKVCYKEGLIKNNIDIIENIIFEIMSQGNSKWQWSQVFQIFFKRLDKAQLRGNDKLKKDPHKIMTEAYFRMLVNKYFYEKARKFDENIKKSDVISLVEDKFKQTNDIKRMIQADEFISYRRF